MSGSISPLKSVASHPLSGSIAVPGDKSISHRAIILGSLTIGQSVVSHLLESTDVLDTVKAMVALGAEISRSNDGEYIINGVGVGGLAEPDNVIDCGNSGTSVRLIMGAIATSSINVTFTGDVSLRNRPMSRVLKPLSLFGASYISRSEGRLPITIKGSSEPMPIVYKLPVASAQVKSAVLLAALNTPGITTIIEEQATRDHTERMLKLFGAKVTSKITEFGNEISVTGFPELRRTNITIPSDPSSAAFPLCAAIMVEGSDIVVPNVCQNPTRNELFSVLIRMGADLTFENIRQQSGEDIADVRARYSPALSGIEISGHRAPSMIDEYPILAMVASVAKGKTTMKGIAELRHKESDRIQAINEGLTAAGVKLEVGKSSLTVYGSGNGFVEGGNLVKVYNDHRIAMSFACLGLVSKSAITIDDSSIIDTSFPNFIAMMRGAGATLQSL